MKTERSSSLGNDEQTGISLQWGGNGMKWLGRWERPLYLAFTLVFGVAAILQIVLGFQQFGWGPDIGLDFAIYRDAAARVVHGQSWFLERQLAGPYDVKMGDVLYPITSAWMFAPFLVLPSILWWSAVPILCVLIVSIRPAMWTWPIIAAAFVFPYTSIRFVTGNPAMWLAVFEALGFRYGFPAVAVLLKPTMAPFALTGVRNRSWWIAAVVLGLATLPGLVQYIQVLRDANIGGSILYPFFDVPLFLVPVVAWLGRGRRTSEDAGLKA